MLQRTGLFIKYVKQGIRSNCTPFIKFISILWQKISDDLYIKGNSSLRLVQALVFQLLRWALSYLSDRFQSICIDLHGHFSELAEVGSAIPQGPVLGPLSFSMYTNGMPGCLKSTLHHMFADDVQLLRALVSRTEKQSEIKPNLCHR